MIAFLLKFALGGWGLVKNALAKLPWWAWAAIAVALIVGWHLHEDGKRLKRADAAGYVRAKAEDKAAIDKLTAHAKVLKQNVESLGAKAAQALKEEHNAKIASVDRDVADIVRGGPGKAGCRLIDAPAAPAAASGREPANRPGNAPLDQVPDRGGSAFLALPLDDAVRFAGQCDILADEAAKWRVNDAKQRALWEQYRKALAAPPK